MTLEKIDRDFAVLAALCEPANQRMKNIWTEPCGKHVFRPRNWFAATWGLRAHQVTHAIATRTHPASRASQPAPQLDPQRPHSKSSSGTSSVAPLARLATPDRTSPASPRSAQALLALGR